MVTQRSFEWFDKTERIVCLEPLTLFVIILLFGQLFVCIHTFITTHKEHIFVGQFYDQNVGI